MYLFHFHFLHSQYEFGDIIMFPRAIGLYAHFAVYVGNEAFNGKKDGDDIFEFSGTCT